MAHLQFVQSKQHKAKIAKEPPSKRTTADLNQNTNNNRQ